MIYLVSPDLVIYPLWQLQHLQDACKLALAVWNVSSVSPAESDDALLQVAQRLVYVHAFFLDRLIRDSAPFQSLLRAFATKFCGDGCSHAKTKGVLDYAHMVPFCGWFAWFSFFL